MRWHTDAGTQRNSASRPYANIDMSLYYGFHDAVRKAVPPGLRKRVRRTRARVMSIYGKWRIRRGVTRILGPQFRRSLDRLELDITYACNLHCFNCNRSCEQARTNDHMSVAQIRHFLAESRDRGQKWRMIRVIGGEPTIHPNFLEIIGLLVGIPSDSFSCYSDRRLHQRIRR